MELKKKKKHTHTYTRNMHTHRKAASTVVVVTFSFLLLQPFSFRLLFVFFVAASLDICASDITHYALLIRASTAKPSSHIHTLGRINRKWFKSMVAYFTEHNWIGRWAAVSQHLNAMKSLVETVFALVDFFFGSFRIICSAFLYIFNKYIYAWTRKIGGN